MKTTLFTLAATLIAVQSFAASSTLTCSSAGKGDYQNNFETFELTANAKTAKLSNITLAADLSKQIPNGIAYTSKAIADKTAFNIKTSKISLAGLKELQSIEKTGANLVINGAFRPYKKTPANPRIRYDLTFADKKIDMSVMADFFAPEGEYALLIVNVKDGQPNYDKVTLQFNGTQGPYNESFNCK